MPEQRAPRIPLNLGIEFRRNYARSNETGALKNISLTGAYLEAPNRLHVQEKVKIKFSVSGRIREVAAHVVWSNENGAGVRFSFSNNQDSQIVDDLMYFVENQRASRRDVFDGILDNVTDD